MTLVSGSWDPLSICFSSATSSWPRATVTTIRISFLMSMIGLLDRDVATVDVVAKFFEPGRVIQNEIVDLVCFFEATISDFNRQLHDEAILVHEIVFRK